jgi:cytochrome P450
MTDYAASLNQKWKDEDTVDILKEMMHLTLSIICKSVLNYDVESETEEIDRALAICRKYSKRFRNPLGQVLNKIPVLPNVKGAIQARKKLDRLVYSLIKERREGLESNVKDYNDLLTRLLHAQDSTQTGDTTVGSATGTASL